MMGSVFAMQGIGQFTAAMIALIVTAGFKNSLLSAASASACDGVCKVAVDKMWRVIIGFGAVPACVALYYRLTIPETPRYTFDVARDVEKAGEDTKAYIQGRSEGHPDEIRRVAAIQVADEGLQPPKASWGDFFRHYSKWRHAKVLIGTAGSWFFLDVAFYGLGLNNSIILQAIGYSKGANMYKIFYNTAVGNLIIVCAGSIPGYWVTVALVDTVGRKPIQLMGFILLTIIFIIIGFAYDHLGQHGLLALYVLAQFFFNFGKPMSGLTENKQSADLLFLRSQRNYFHRAWRMLPHPLPVNLARHLCCFWQGRRHYRSDHLRTPTYSWCSSWLERLSMARPCYGDLCLVYVVRCLHHFIDPRNQAQDSRGVGG